MSRARSSARFRFTGAALLLAVLVFLVPALRNGDSRLYLLAALVPCGILLCSTVLARIFSLDRLILGICCWICSAGIAAFAFSDPDAALIHALRCGAGMAALLVGGILVRSLSPSLLASLCSAFLGLLLLLGKMLSPDFSFPVTEAALALLLIAFASLFSRQGPASAALTGVIALALLLLSGEKTEALFWGITVLLLLFAADGRFIVVLPSLAVILLLFFGAYLFLPPVQPVPVPSLSSLASAGAVGADSLPEEFLSAGSIPLFHRLAGHFGLIFAGFTVLLILPLVLRGVSVAGSARTRFHAVLAMGVCLLISLHTLTGMLSAFGLFPWASADFPLLTSSMPDLCAQLFLIGLLCGISGRNDADLADDAHLAMLAK